jgi:hypothetical protein
VEYTVWTRLPTLSMDLETLLRRSTRICCCSNASKVGDKRGVGDVSTRLDWLASPGRSPVRAELLRGSSYGSSSPKRIRTFSHSVGHGLEEKKIIRDAASMPEIFSTFVVFGRADGRPVHSTACSGW